MAELKYNFGDSEWKAEVTTTEGGFQVVIQTRNGDRVNTQQGGVFATGAACVKYVRELAAKKFPEWKPSVDTLDSIKHRTANSVTPDCYQPVSGGVPTGGRGFDRCPGCPYRERCGDALAALVTEQAAESVQEQDDNFLTRLQAKVKAQYGEGEDHE